MLLLLAGCGGSGGGSSSTPVVTGPISLNVDCSGTTCSNISTTNYSSSSTDILSIDNSGTVKTDVTLRLNNASGKQVTLVWTNTNSNSTVSAPSSSSAAYIEGDAGNSVASDLRKRMAEDMVMIKKTLSDPAAKTSGFNALQAQPLQAAYAVNDTHSWYEAATSKTISTTLRSQATLSNSSKLNIWVQDSEWNTSGGDFKVTQTMVDTLRDKFAASNTGIFDMATNLTGSQPWGSHSFPSLLIGDTQDLHIVITNFDSNSKPAGLLGYFYSLHNFLKTTSTSYSNSNEALMFFIDSETLASPTNSATYQAQMASVLSHEFVHMINFYQRYILNSVSFDDWLEETTAMMMQDITDTRVNGTYHNLRDNWFPNWLGSSAYNCRLTDYIESTSDRCFSYDIGGSYGGFLLRQYGLSFYKDLVQSTESDSITALESVIKKYDASSSFASTIRRWGTAIALLNSSSLPAGFGYPTKTETVSSVSYTLPAINGPDFSAYRVIPALPSTLVSRGHAAQKFTATSANFNRKVVIPAGTSLTVIVN